MDIIFHGKHDEKDALQSFASVFHLFHERYSIHSFREMRLSVTLMDDAGSDVELVDQETNNVYRTFEIYRQGQEFKRSLGRPALKLVIDNS